MLHRVNGIDRRPELGLIGDAVERRLGLLTKDSTLYNETTATMVELRKLIADIQVNPRKYFKFSVF